MIQRTTSDFWLKNDEPFYHEYDFDGDSRKEIAVYYHPDTGGTYATHDYTFYKKDNDGKYHFFNVVASTGADGGQLMDYKGRYYFVKNPEGEYREPNYSFVLENIAPNQDQNQILCVRPQQYTPQAAVVQTAPEAQGMDGAFWEAIEAQTLDAIAASHGNRLYIPTHETAASIHPEILTDALEDENSYIKNLKYHYTLVDYDNDGQNDYRQRIRHESHWKYKTEYLWFNLYQDEEALLESATGAFDDDDAWDYSGRVSKAGLYVNFPVPGKVAQLWTYVYHGKTYTMILTRDQIVYQLSVFLAEDKDVRLLRRILILDTPSVINVAIDPAS